MKANSAVGGRIWSNFVVEQLYERPRECHIKITPASLSQTGPCIPYLTQAREFRFSYLSFCQYFVYQTPPCIYSICLHFVDQARIVSFKAVEQVDRDIKALFMNIKSHIQ